MDLELIKLAKDYAEALVEYYQSPPGNVNRVPQERRDALDSVKHSSVALEQRARWVAQQLVDNAAD